MSSWCQPVSRSPRRRIGRASSLPHRPDRSAGDVLKGGEIRRIYEENYEAFGARKMHVMLNRSEAGAHHGAGHVARCTVERFMRAMSISGIRRAKSPNTTRSTPKDQCPMDRVNRHFAALAPNILWVADITYVKTRAGWVIRRVRHRRLLASDPGVADHPPACTPTSPSTR